MISPFISYPQVDAPKLKKVWDATEKCNICYEMFTPEKGKNSLCENCGRNFCPKDAGVPLEEGTLIEGTAKYLCRICAQAYGERGVEGLATAKSIAFKTHNS